MYRTQILKSLLTWHSYQNSPNFYCFKQFISISPLYNLKNPATLKDNLVNPKLLTDPNLIQKQNRRAAILAIKLDVKSAVRWRPQINLKAIPQTKPQNYIQSVMRINQPIYFITFNVKIDKRLHWIHYQFTPNKKDRSPFII